MSRVARNPIKLPNGVALEINEGVLCVNGSKGKLHYFLDRNIRILEVKNGFIFSPKVVCRKYLSLAGTARAIVNNMIIGVSIGFEKTLLLQGVGYRVTINGKLLNLALGFSHSIDYAIPRNVSVECTNQTTIIIKGIDKQRVGQVASEIRAFRPPEPYKGKGIRYIDEIVRRKEAKKK